MGYQARELELLLLVIDCQIDLENDINSRRLEMQWIQGSPVIKKPCPKHSYPVEQVGSIC